jgi:two-component system chemotaxis response regulator CheV
MASLEGVGEGKRVLVVDDSRTAILLLQSVLGKLGFATTALMSADKALEFLKTEYGTVDLIISDIEMPGMDGFTFTRAVRDHADFKNIKVILNSSMSNPSNRLKAEQAGADRFVAKFDPQSLSEEILALIAVGGKECADAAV